MTRIAILVLVLLLIQNAIPADPAAGDTVILNAGYSEAAGMGVGETEARQGADSILTHGERPRTDYLPVRADVVSGAGGMSGNYSTGKDGCVFYDLFGRRVSLDQNRLRSINVLVQQTDGRQRTRSSVFLKVADIFR